MYTYPALFVGLPLSQFQESVPPWIVELGRVCSEYELSLEDLDPDTLDEDYSDLEYSQTRMFLNWAYAQREELTKLRFAFHCNYHGGDEQPVIFGRYVPDWFRVPAFSLERADFSHLAKIEDLQVRMHKVFSTLPESIASDVQGLLGVWFNNHSS